MSRSRRSKEKYIADVVEESDVAISTSEVEETIATTRPSRSRAKVIRYGDEDMDYLATLDDNDKKGARSKKASKVVIPPPVIKQSLRKPLKKSRYSAGEDEDDEEEEEVNGDGGDEGSVDYNNDDDVPYSRKASKTHQLKYSECEEATEEGEKYLSKHVAVFESFITPKVNATLQRQHKMIIGNKKLRELYYNDTIEQLGQPSTIVNCTLRDYQIEGISWIVDRYDKAINVILADEMGLGKTLQTISFIAHLVHVRGLKGPHLVVVPLSVLFNWVQELKKWCPLLKFVRLHANDSAEQERLKVVIKDATQTEVVLTTYETVKSAKLSGALRRIIWRSVILDEGHKLKNEDSAIHNAAKNLKSRFKLILTGTPVQNNLHETYALLSYLAPNIFKDSETFDNAFNLNSNGRQIVQVDREMLTKAHYMMRPFILRRLKIEVEKALPPKLETKIRCPMSEMQKYWIKSLLLKEKDALHKVSSTGNSSLPGGSDWRKLNSLMAQLRKAANHPYLFEGAEPASLDGRANEDIISASGKMMVLDRLLTKLHERGHRVVLFSQYTRTLDIISDYLVYRGYDATCRLDGQTNRVMREVYINMFNKKDSKKFIFLLSTRAGGEGVNLFTADTVILFDSDWNPQVDIQAMARVHRIGQTKPVHVYRLVSSGSVEERIVQRAQKKLFLDSMVNRGSTANAKLIDAQMNLPAEGEEDEDKKDDIEPSKILSALKFGWNSIFSVNTATQELSDEDLEVILDRTRGEDGPNVIGGMENDESDGLREGVQSTVEDFDETVPLVSIRELDGEEIPRGDSSSLRSISESWREYALPDGSKRKRKARTHEVKVDGVGMVQVLNSDDYTLEQGEPSVFDAEVKPRVAPKSVQTFVPTSGRQVAGRDYSHQDFCQVCWDGGELLSCDICPAAYHMHCLGLTKLPASVLWQCPHHVCCNCQRKSSAAGLLFRCEVCPNAFCEDCLPMDHTVTGDSERLNRLGFRLPGSACYILCQQACIDFYYHLSKTESGEIVPQSRHRSDALSKKMQNAAKLSILSAESDQLERSDGVTIDFNDPLRSLGMCQLGDVKIRLLRNNDARFTCLKEINGFTQRWETLSVHTKTIFTILVNSITSQFDSQSEEIEDASIDTALAYKGVPRDASNEGIYKAFLNMTRRLTEIHKGKIVDMCRLCGISVISIMKRVSLNPDKQAAQLQLALLSNAPALPPCSIEPKFKQVEDSLPRRCLEEMLASFLVLPHPQNLIVATTTSDDKSCSNCPDLPLPLGSTVYVARLVEGLGDRIVDPNKKYFSSISVREGECALYVHGWNDTYIGKAPMSLSELRIVMDPVRRLHKLQKDTIPRSVRILIDDTVTVTKSKNQKAKYDFYDVEVEKQPTSASVSGTADDGFVSLFNETPVPLTSVNKDVEKKKRKRVSKKETSSLPSSAAMLPPPMTGTPFSLLNLHNSSTAMTLPPPPPANPFALNFINPLALRAPLMMGIKSLPIIGNVLQLEDFSKVSHLLHEWTSPIKQVPSSTSGFIIQVTNCTMSDWSIGRLSVEMIRTTFTPYEGLHSRMRYPKFALQLQQLHQSQGLLVPIDEHVELIFILMFKFFAIDFRISNVVDLALDKAQEEGYMIANESILSPAIVSIMRNAECFRKLFGVVIEKMKLNIKNRIQNLGEGPTVWLHGETITQLKETILDESRTSLREGQFMSYKSAGPGINFRCSQTVIEAISCSLGQYSLRHEVKNGFASDYTRQTTANQEAIVLALLKWYFSKGAVESPDDKTWDEWVGDEARKMQPMIEADRAVLERNRELCAFLSGCRKRYFSMNPLISNNEYMT